MELYQLRSFVAVAREKHLTRAAEKLNASQPAVSAHIKALEEELTLSLFERTAKGMLLTPGGQTLYKQAKMVLKEADLFLHLGESLVNKPSGTIRIGLNRNAEFLKIRPLYQKLRSNYHELELILHQSVSGTILKEIKNDALDCGFVLGGSDDASIEVVELARFPLRVVGPIDLQSKIEQADIAELAALPWIGVPADSPYSRIMKRYFHSQGHYPHIGVIADEQSAITSMIESGAGLNFMLEEEALQAEQKGRIALWQKGTFTIALSFAYRTKDKESIQLHAVKQIITEIWSQADSIPLSPFTGKTV